MFLNDISGFLAKLPGEVAGIFRVHDDELRGVSSKYSSRLVELRKVRDQLNGPPGALDEIYHPDNPGLSEDQRQYIRRILARSHVNLVEPALDRLVNSIHSGRIRREVSDGFPAVKKAVTARRHASAMARLCENAFAYGTGYLAPMINARGRLWYWLPDPLRTVLLVDRSDIYTVLGIAELVPDAKGGNSHVRFLTADHQGMVFNDDREPSISETTLGFAPLVVAYGRDRRHEGDKYGKSLLVGVADASIRVTNNEVNLELLRDRQTQALLVVTGEPARTSVDDQAAKNKYLQFPKDGGDAHYETPESRIEAVIELTKRFAEDAAISSGLPLDTFLPSLIAGSDASATAARIRAFPLEQRMARLVMDWEGVEEETVSMVAAVLLSDVKGMDVEAVQDMVGARVSIIASLPEAAAETLAGWQQKLVNFLAPVEEAIEYYNPGIDDETKAGLAEAWRLVNDPRIKNGAADQVAKFQREIAKALYGGATTKEVMANLTDLRALVDAVGLPRESDYQEPWLPVVAPVGGIVTGEALRDSEGDVVGGVVGEMPEDIDARDAQEGASR
jgi:hypothetical protein